MVIILLKKILVNNIYCLIFAVQKTHTHMKKTQIYICEKAEIFYKKENCKLLTEFEGLYEAPSGKHEISVNDVLYNLREIKDDFTKEGVTRCLFLVKF